MLKQRKYQVGEKPRPYAHYVHKRNYKKVFFKIFVLFEKHGVAYARARAQSRDGGTQGKPAHRVQFRDDDRSRAVGDQTYQCGDERL